MPFEVRYDSPLQFAAAFTAGTAQAAKERERFNQQMRLQQAQLASNERTQILTNFTNRLNAITRAAADISVARLGGGRGGGGGSVGRDSRDLFSQAGYYKPDRPASRGGGRSSSAATSGDQEDISPTQALTQLRYSENRLRQQKSADVSLYDNLIKEKQASLDNIYKQYPLGIPEDNRPPEIDTLEREIADLQQKRAGAAQQQITQEDVVNDVTGTFNRLGIEYGPLTSSNELTGMAVGTGAQRDETYRAQSNAVLAGFMSDPTSGKARKLLERGVIDEDTYSQVSDMVNIMQMDDPATDHISDAQKEAIFLQNRQRAIRMVSDHVKTNGVPSYSDSISENVAYLPSPMPGIIPDIPLVTGFEKLPQIPAGLNDMIQEGIKAYGSLQKSRDSISAQKELAKEQRAADARANGNTRESENEAIGAWFDANPDQKNRYEFYKRKVEAAKRDVHPNTSAIKFFAGKMQEIVMRARAGARRGQQ